MTGYGIRKIFETTALGNYSSSPGTIYPALKRLQKLGMAEKLESKDDGKSKFFITPLGEQLFKSWLIQPLSLTDVEKKLDEVILRFGFMDSLSNQREKVLFLETLGDLLTDYCVQLEDYHKKEYDNLPLHGRLAFEHGIASYKTTLKWCNNTLLLFKKTTEK